MIEVKSYSISINYDYIFKSNIYTLLIIANICLTRPYLNSVQENGPWEICFFFMVRSLNTGSFFIPVPIHLSAVLMNKITHSTLSGG